MGSITVRWPAELNEHGAPLLWFGSWLTGNAGFESGWFYSGRGDECAEYSIPSEATGLRIRRWPNEGLDAEYSDVLALESLSELMPSSLGFDAPQPFSRFASEHASAPTTPGDAA
ncbi:MAG: hypothetical protein ABIP13_03585 [Tepidiformaceae bacterium]